MKVCYFGTYHSTYPGNSILIEGLKKNGVEVLECHIPLGELTRSKYHAYRGVLAKLGFFLGHIPTYIRLVYKYLCLERHDIIIVGYMGQFDMFLAKLLSLIYHRPITFNPMFSLYDTIVLDRELYTPSSLVAKILKLLDRWAFRLADITFLDCWAHMKIWIDEIGCEKEKIRHLFFGASDKIFYTRNSDKRSCASFNVLFYGTFMPSQGIPFIVKAAKLLEGYSDIKFRIIGYGQVSKEVNCLADELQVKNIEFINWVNFEELPLYISEANVCLGMFGVTPKTKRCIANKVVQSIAMKKAVITADVPAMRELLTDKQSVYFCEAGNPESIAEAILKLKMDETLRVTISENAYNLFRTKLSPGAIGKMAKEYCEELLIMKKEKCG